MIQNDRISMGNDEESWMKTGFMDSNLPFTDIYSALFAPYGFKF
jgi:hypothetical protein